MMSRKDYERAAHLIADGHSADDWIGTNGEIDLFILFFTPDNQRFDGDRFSSRVYEIIKQKDEESHLKLVKGDDDAGN